MFWMMIVAVKVKYPAVLYSEKFISTHRWKPNTSLRSYLDRKGFIGNVIIDSVGNQFVIKDVGVQGVAFPSWHNLHHKDKIMRIKLICEWQRKMTFDEVRYEINDLFERHPKWWTKARKEHLKELWASAASIKQLVDMGYASGNP